MAHAYMSCLREAFKIGEPIEHFHSFATSTGDVHFHSRIVPEKNAAGEVETVLAIARDITEIQKAQAVLLKLQETSHQEQVDELFKNLNLLKQA